MILLVPLKGYVGHELFLPCITKVASKAIPKWPLKEQVGLKMVEASNWREGQGKGGKWSLLEFSISAE